MPSAPLDFMPSPAVSRMVKSGERHVFGCDQQAFAGAGLAREIKDSFAFPGPAQSHAFNVER